MVQRLKIVRNLANMSVHRYSAQGTNPLGLLSLGAEDTERLDLSNYLVHFTNGTSDKDAYDNQMSILASGELRSGLRPVGCSRRIDELRAVNRCVSLSEAPLGFLSQLAIWRSPYGIGFTKEFIAAQNGQPVWYVAHDSQIADALRELQQSRLGDGATDSTEPIWKICPFIDFTQNSGPRYRYEWEREWRVPEKLSFTIDDVAFLLIPEELHSNARGFFESVRDEYCGPSYELCPYVDGRWNLEKILKLISGDR